MIEGSGQLTGRPRILPQKVVKMWWRLSEEERGSLVEELIRYVEDFEEPQVFVSKDKRRPRDDKHARLGIPSDPVYAVYAFRKGSTL